jgi:DNA-binding NarL/FixJ family response regulator
VREKLAALLLTLPNVEIGGQAGTAAQAIAAIAERRPDVVILDISMPGGSGLDVLRAVKRTAPSTVMIVLTMHPYQQLGAGCAAAGADVYFEKNAEFGRLAAVLGILGRSGRSPAALRRLLQRYGAATHAGARAVSPRVASPLRTPSLSAAK